MQWYQRCVHGHAPWGYYNTQPVDLAKHHQDTSQPALHHLVTTASLVHTESVVLRSRHTVGLPRVNMTSHPGDTITPNLQTWPCITNIIISLNLIILSICDLYLCPLIPANKKTKMLYEMFLL